MEKPNKLIDEKSPYLLQHAHNPVEWYPWGGEAFDTAKRDSKPIFLSIGYSTCHWCHVMERESFEDPEIAKLLNDTFVSIKVDREERPDIDMFYMQVCQMMTGRGGWPLTIIMTPEKEPFYAATYIPRDSRFGMIGMRELIPQIKDMWKKNKRGLTNTGLKIIENVRTNELVKEKGKLELETLHLGYFQLLDRFDKKYGGFSSAPKFPTPHNLLFLLRYWKRTGKKQALKMVEKTLEAMRYGGVFDQVGYGFHRYSTDERWIVPHFEKMLYDQALMLMAYTEAFQVTNNQFYRRVANEIITYVVRDMMSPEGGFYSAEDADSEGEEGRFYLWTVNEIKENLSPKEAGVAIKIFNIKPEGNFLDESTRKTTGSNILYQSVPVEKCASQLNITIEDLSKMMEKIRQNLFGIREGRVRPFLDDKILTSWNGLMIAALAKASLALDEPEYLKTAQKATFFIKNVLTKKGRLIHRFRDGESSVQGFLNDYAFLIWGLIELYDASLDAQFLKLAVELNETLLEHFWDEDEGGFYFSANDWERMPIRRKMIYDGALPSGNSVAMFNLLRLAKITGNVELEEKAELLRSVFYGNVSDIPIAHTQLMVALDYGLGPSYEVVVVGDPQKEDTINMLHTLRKGFKPRIVVQLKSRKLEEIADFIKSYSMINDKATAYVCKNYQCNLPTNNIEEALKIMDD
jgi:uncharacterized protein YyaL (SSP411 family)